MSLDFIILGAQKAATSSLHRALRETEGIYMPPGESPFFEDPDYRRRRWEELRDPTGRAAVMGIKRPDNLCRSDLIARIHAQQLDLKYVVVLRDPVARGVSAYFHLVRHARLPLMPLDDALSMAVREFEAGREGPWSSIITFGLYGRYLREWFGLFDKRRFLVLSQSAVASDLDAALAGVQRHLGVKESPRVTSGAVNENAGMYDTRWIRMYAAGHRLQTKPVGGTPRRVRRDNRIVAAAGAGVCWAARRLADDERRPPPLGAAVRDRLWAIYAEDLELLRPVVPSDAVDWSAPDIRERGSR